MKRKKGIRADIVFFCTTIFFIGLSTILFLNMDKTYRELLAVNDQLLETLENNRTTYNQNLEEVRDYAQENYDKYAEEFSLRMKMEERLKSGVSKYSEAQIYLLAQCVQAEAGYPENHGTAQKMICQVILNRVDSGDFPDTIEEVIYDKTGGTQFSVAYNGSLEEQIVEPETLNNVYEVIMFGYDIPHEIQYFYSAFLKEDNWVKTLKVYDTVEGTVFAYNEVKE